MAMPRKTILMLMAASVLAGCASSDEVTLTKLRNTGNGPDEFSIIPSKPLQTPEDYSRLPVPAPGAANLTDQNPRAEGIAALGGNPAGAPGSQAQNAALLNHAARFGPTTGIRQTLASEDLERRRQYGRVNVLRILPGDDYVQAYRNDWLDAYAEERRLRNRGVQTPASPPPTDN